MIFLKEFIFLNLVRIVYYYYPNPSFLLQPLGNRPSQWPTPLDEGNRRLKYEINQRKKKNLLYFTKKITWRFIKKKPKITHFKNIISIIFLYFLDNQIIGKQFKMRSKLQKILSKKKKELQKIQPIIYISFLSFSTSFSFSLHFFPLH